ncbi:PEP-CTERM sorting domain-containing protein [Cyanobacterium sp. Dongsha4]|uniref:PEP-CTERM sorting domain-containing protein n=1 Tax=Cyanobacterium sp. DS4 TaxID=2878255 RepID=UPI002E80FC5A|nr:PEP-CTERM sorting domain-containing protein [Cyanobacterium sp. Dongsha4]WVK99896.1 PEP-CTERM sorting domain-containing protein [Cyanobacterium sp. Dongsha4]
MNKILSLSLVPLAATATVATIALTPDSAQAVTIGSVQIAGQITYTEHTVNDYLDFHSFNVSFGGTGILSGLNGLMGPNAVADIFLGAVNGVNGTYNGTTSDPFITFANGVKFAADNPISTILNFSGDGQIDIPSFTGTFYNGTTALGQGVLSAQKLANGSYSMTIEASPVPEPLTILGTGLALGLGGLFKSKQSKKQSVEA